MRCSSPDRATSHTDMPARTSSSALITAKLKGRRVSRVITDGPRRLAVHFSDGTILLLEATADKLTTTLDALGSQSPDKSRPTIRQYDYLEFIAKYSARFGRSPAESDIERHFLVSAPSVNQMMQTLERRGFITRQPGVPRSIRICVDLSGRTGSGLVNCISVDGVGAF